MNSIAELLGGEYGNDRAFLSPGGMVQGTVTDNAESGEPGMVKVEFTAWKSGKNVCEWIPLLRPYAGKDYGSYLVPEVGDIVLVGFIGTDFRRPVVLGSLFPATAQMKSDSFEKKNTTRRFKTKGGVDLGTVDLGDDADGLPVGGGGDAGRTASRPRRWEAAHDPRGQERPEPAFHRLPEGRGKP